MKQLVHIAQNFVLMMVGWADGPFSLASSVFKFQYNSTLKDLPNVNVTYGLAQQYFLDMLVSIHENTHYRQNMDKIS